MSLNIITGYTGERHITPNKDAVTNEALIGTGSFILDFGNRLEGSMPTVNEFKLMDGEISVQGRLAIGTQQTLSVDSCMSGKKRIDLVVARYTKDVGTSIEGFEYKVIKGEAVDAANTPTAPAYNSGSIAGGATVVDFPLYRINLTGGTATFSRLAAIIGESISDLSTNKVDATSLLANIDTSAAAGTDDGDLYRAIDALGWSSNVISGGKGILKRLLTKVLTSISSLNSKSEYIQNGESYTVNSAYLFGMTNGSGTAFATMPIFLPKKIPNGATITVTGSWLVARKYDGTSLNISSTVTAGKSGDNAVYLSGTGTSLGYNISGNFTTSEVTLTFNVA